MADNGVGFDTSVESEGQGLTSMRRRAQRLKGTLEITSASGLGTTVAAHSPDVMPVDSTLASYGNT